MNADQLIDIWESNRFEITTALRQAGGNSEMLIEQTPWRVVLSTLAKNNIRIEARYIGDHDE